MTAATGVFRLASIFIRYRLLSMRNAFRARGRGRRSAVVAVVAVVAGAASVGAVASAVAGPSSTAAVALVATTAGVGASLSCRPSAPCTV